MPHLEITDVRLEPATSVRGHVDYPRPGTSVEAGALDLIGWALGDAVPVVAVELVRDGRVFRRVPLGVARPDLATAFPDVPSAGEAGFRGSVSLLGDGPLSLQVRAVLADQRRVPIATLRGDRRWAETTRRESELASVVIPCYDQAHFLGEAIESVLAQTYSCIDLLVVDDGSHDNTAAVAARYPGIKYVRQENQGLAAARNTGIRYTNGDFLVFLDADDRLLPHALETGLRHMRKHPDAAFVWGRWRLILDRLELDTPEPLEVGTQPYRLLLTGCVISCPAAVMYCRGPLEELGGFDSTVDASADYDMYLRLARVRAVAFHDEIVADYRLHGTNMNRDPGLIMRSELAVLRRHRKHARSVAGGESAHRAGRKRTRDYHGRALSEHASELASRRQWSELFSTLAILLRHNPKRLSLALVALAHGGRGGDREGPPPVGSVDLGGLRRLKPISEVSGFDRGRPIERYYIERFLRQHGSDIRGRVLEVGDSRYTRAFGGDRVSSSDVLDVKPGNPQATLVTDLADGDSLPSEQFDCIILAQTLHYIYDARSAVRTLSRMLRPGGVVLATVPGISQVSRDEWAGRWCWSFTDTSARRLFEEAFGDVEVETHGNVLVASAMLYGLAAEELRTDELEHVDPRYPVSITIRALKGATPTSRPTFEPHLQALGGEDGRGRAGAKPRAAPALILLYHRIATLPFDPWSLAVAPRRFAGHLAALCEWGTPLSLHALTEQIKRGEICERAFAVTFDDGYVDWLHEAEPALSRFDVPATFFVTTGAIEGEREYWWDELAQLFLNPGTLPPGLAVETVGSTNKWTLQPATYYPEETAEAHCRWRAWERPPTARHAVYRALWDLLYSLTPSERTRVLDELWDWAGVNRTPDPTFRALSPDELRRLAQSKLADIGAHGASHAALAAIPPAAQREDILRSKLSLESVLGSPVTSFSYPFGKRSDYTHETTRIVREAGFLRACTGIPSVVGENADVFQLPRFHVDDWSQDEFRARLDAWLDGEPTGVAAATAARVPRAV